MKIAYTVIIAVVALVVLVRLGERRMVFFPTRFPDGIWDTEPWGIRVTDVEFNASDGVRLHGWLLANEASNRIILWSHGNAGNLSHRVENLALMAQLGVNVLIFDYRGYGKSEGRSPTEDGVYLDAQAAYDEVRRRGFAPEDIVIFGRSLGGAVAVDLASKNPCAALVLESTFPNAGAMARLVIPPLPLDWVIQTRFESDRKIASITVPKLFLHGTSDNVVPYRLGRRLFEAAPEPKKFVDLPGANHNNTYALNRDGYLKHWVEFLDKLQEPRLKAKGS